MTMIDSCFPENGITSKLPFQRRPVSAKAGNGYRIIQRLWLTGKVVSLTRMKKGLASHLRSRFEGDQANIL